MKPALVHPSMLCVLALLLMPLAGCQREGNSEVEEEPATSTEAPATQETETPSMNTTAMGTEGSLAPGVPVDHGPSPIQIHRRSRHSRLAHEQPPAAMRAHPAGSPRLRPNYAIVRVFYGTDRQDAGSEAGRARYGGDRGVTTYGACEVSIPRDHQPGQLESPSWLRLEFHEDPEKHVVVLAVTRKGRQELVREMQADVGPTKREALVFVHGYNVSFEDAARRTAQLKYDLAFTGPAVFFSWPSQGSLSGYMADEGNIEWSEIHLQDFFHLLAAELRVDSIYLIAHSMGTRGATKALNRLTGQYGAAERAKFKEVILAAPDIDKGIFQEEILPQLKAESSRLTLYASSADEALMASWKAHQQRRLGDSTGGIFVAPGLDSIDASAVETDFLGHSYFASSRSILRDIGILLLKGTPIQNRPLFRSVKVAEGTYYVFQP